MRKRKMRHRIHSIISIGITAIVLIFILIIWGVMAMEPVSNITSSTPVISTDTYYFD